MNNLIDIFKEYFMFCFSRNKYKNDYMIYATISRYMIYGLTISNIIRDNNFMAIYTFLVSLYLLFNNLIFFASRYSRFILEKTITEILEKFENEKTDN